MNAWAGSVLLTSSNLYVFGLNCLQNINKNHESAIQLKIPCAILKTSICFFADRNIVRWALQSVTWISFQAGVSSAGGGVTSSLLLSIQMGSSLSFAKSPHTLILTSSLSDDDDCSWGDGIIGLGGVFVFGVEVTRAKTGESGDWSPSAAVDLRERITSGEDGGLNVGDDLEDSASGFSLISTSLSSGIKLILRR